jgi:hypothetical protein
VLLTGCAKSVFPLRECSVQLRYNFVQLRERKNDALAPKRHRVKHLEF